MGYLYVNGLKNTIESNRIYLNYLYRQEQKRRSRFRVINGLKEEKEEKDDKPTYH